MRTPLALWMGFAIAAMVLLAYWDAQRESGAALGDFAQEQATLAHAVSTALGTRIASATEDPPAASLAAEFRSIEQPGLRILIAKPGADHFVFGDGQPIHQSTILSALNAGSSSVRLSREEAAALGFPARTAIAGLSTFDGKDGKWGVAVVASAGRERDREIRAQWRDVLGVLVTSALVFGFGGLALRKQRKELSLAAELAVTEKEMERDERLVRADKLATLGALATGIAHEVSTPLGVIAGRAEQIAPRVAGDERAKLAVEAILEQSKRINDIVRGFLGLARGHSPTLVRIDPAVCVQAACELVQHRFDKAEVTLSVEVDPNLPRIACEPRLFEQVLVNLLLNACEACSPRGHVGVRVVASGERIAFVVIDDGEGITADAAARAVEPFFTTKPEGTGLGLAITNEIVKHHHGTFSIAPRPNQAGTRACVELPAASIG